MRTLKRTSCLYARVSGGAIGLRLRGDDSRRVVLLTHAPDRIFWNACRLAINYPEEECGEVLHNPEHARRFYIVTDLLGAPARLTSVSLATNTMRCFRNEQIPDLLSCTVICNISSTAGAVQSPNTRDGIRSNDHYGKGEGCAVVALISSWPSRATCGGSRCTLRGGKTRRPKSRGAR